MKYLVINADDFGNSASVNKGIIEGIKKGIITSISLMVYRKYAEEAVQLKSFNNIQLVCTLNFLKIKMSILLENLKLKLPFLQNLWGKGLITLILTRLGQKI